MTDLAFDVSGVDEKFGYLLTRVTRHCWRES